MASSSSVSERKIVLLGKTGDGKSSAGNTIIGENVFTTKASANAVTDKYVSAEGMVDGRKITVIDMPGFIDTDHDDEEIKSEVTKALTECAPAVDAFVMVLRVGRYTRHENEVFQQFLNTVTEDALKHTVILFTFGEQLEDQTIEEFVKVNSQLQELVNKCGGRCHVIDNKYWNNCHSGDKSNRFQVKNLMETIDKMVKENGCYSNELLQMVEEEIQEVMKKNEDNLPPEEKRKKAKKMVDDILLRRVAGTATGALFGALLGVGVAVAAVVVVIRQLWLVTVVLKGKVATEKAAVPGGAVVAGGAVAAGGAAIAGGAAAAEAAGGAAVAGGAAAAEAAGGAAVAGGAAAAEAAGGAAVAGGAAAAEAAGGAAVAGGAAAAEAAGGAAVAGGAAAAEAAGGAAIAGGAAAAEAAGGAAIAGGAAAAEAAGGAAIAGGAAAAEAAGGAAVAGGAAAAEAAGGAAIAGGAAAAEAAGGAAVAGGAAAAEAAGGAAAKSGAAAGAGVSAGTIAVGVLGVAALAGAAGGGVTGWKAAEDADSWHDAMNKAVTTNFENAKATVEKIQEFVTLVLNNKQHSD